MNYPQYLFWELLKNCDEVLANKEYDLQYKKIIKEYTKFYISSYNKPTRDLYSCIEDYLKYQYDIIKLWENFWNIPINDNDEILKDFHIWESWTDRMAIWDWFDDKKEWWVISLINDY